jgi:hypothetical protein
MTTQAAPTISLWYFAMRTQGTNPFASPEAFALDTELQRLKEAHQYQQIGFCSKKKTKKERDLSSRMMVNF